jgi:MtrB/PioB family decaheme-associated outer membrane protein
MRIHVSLICCLGLAIPSAASAQAVAQPPASTSAVLSSADPQSASATAAPAQPDPASELARRSLFEPTWRQFQIGGRFTSIDGDPARFQRYQDIRDGILFTDARFERAEPTGKYLFHASADNVGWRDQRFAADYERSSSFVVSAMWDEIPQFYSIDTKTPYTTTVSPLLLDDGTQRAIQNGQATLSAYVPIAPQFDLRERRDIGMVNVLATPTPQLDVKAGFTTTRHSGELPWGASFGFSNDVEVALPYDSRTNEFNLGTEWMNGRNMLRVSYTGSWFNNLDDTLVWDSPLRVDDSSSAPGRGRTALWPTNSAQTVSAAGYTKFAHRTQLTGFISFGFWNNDEPLQPFTINSALPEIALPRANAEAQAQVFSTNLNLVSRPTNDWQFSARVRRYDYNNQTPHATLPDYVSYDSSINQSLTGGPALYAHSRTTFDADAIWSRLAPVALTVGYTRNDGGYDFRIFNSTAEDVLRLAADAVGSQWLTFRAQYELAGRSGSGLNENLLVQIGEQPDMRHFDIANRMRNRFTGQVDVVPNDLVTFSMSGGVGKDDYDDSGFGLQESTFRTFSLGADFRHPNGLGGGATYNFERYAGLQRSRSANSDQFEDPTRDWTVDSAETVNYFSIYAAPPRIGRNTEARVSYDFSYAEGSYLYTVVPGGPLPPPSQLPNVYNKLQQLHVDVRHRLASKLGLTVSYLYEPFRVFDFAFDQSVVNGIVQPSSLVMGYVYRPYTAHSATVGLKYFW